MELEYIDTYKYDSVDIAYLIVAWANKNNVSVNITKIQKLLYIAYGAHLVVSRTRLCREHPQAWPYGPVFPSTRNKLLKENLDAITMDNSIVKKSVSDNYLQGLVQFVFAGFGKYNANTLTQWSHKEGSPWEQTTQLNGFKWGDPIPDDFIIDYFAKLIIFKGDGSVE